MAHIATAVLLPAKVITEAAGVPGAGIVLGALEAIVKQCEEVAELKDECEALGDLCRKLLNAIQEATLDGEEKAKLRQDVDELVLKSSLEASMQRIHRWADCNWFKRWWKRDDLRAEIKQGKDRVEVALKGFNAKTIVDISATTAEIKKINYHNSVTLALMSQKQEHLEFLIKENHRSVTLAQVPASYTGGLSPSTRTLRVVHESPQYQKAARETAALLNLGLDSTVENLDGQVNIADDNPVAGGVFSDVYKGVWVAGKEVAIKAMRDPKASDPEARKKFDRQIKVWRGLSHPNIAKFYGTTTDAVYNRFCLVSAWQPHGNVNKYLEEHPDGNRLDLMCSAAEGLAYLHANNIIHGNVRCANILVSHEIEARICDFAVSKVLQDATQSNAVVTMTTGNNMSTRWMPPELIASEEPKTSVKSDVYAFGMTILECVTGERPYADIKRDTGVIYALNTQRHPERPSGPAADRWMSDDLWALLKKCWAWNPEERPTMAEVASRLKVIEAATRRR